MATQTEPATSAIFRALRSVDVDPDLAYEAAEESRRQAGENVIAAIGAKIDSQSARIDVKFSQIESQITEGRWSVCLPRPSSVCSTGLLLLPLVRRVLS